MLTTTARWFLNNWFRKDIGLEIWNSELQPASANLLYDLDKMFHFCRQVSVKGHFLLGGERSGGGRGVGRDWQGGMRLGSWDPGPRLGRPGAQRRERCRTGPSQHCSRSQLKDFHPLWVE